MTLWDTEHYVKLHPCHTRNCQNLIPEDDQFCEDCADYILYRIRDDRRRDVQAQYDWFEVAWYWVFVLILCIGIPCVLFNLVRFLGWME